MSSLPSSNDEWREQAVTSAESLARRFFELLGRLELSELTAMLHPEVTFTPRIPEGKVLHGPDDVRAFYEGVRSWRVYEPTVTTFVPVADDVIVVRGRVRWMKDSSLDDVPAAWLLVFKDGLLLRFQATLTVEQALEAAQQLHE
jgi:ketosteroid isomerase-like protein